MTSVDVEIEPPGLPVDEDDDGEPYTAVHVLIGEHDDTRRAGYCAVPGNGSDADVADCMLAALRAVAAARGPGLVAALEQRLQKESG